MVARVRHVDAAIGARLHAHARGTAPFAKYVRVLRLDGATAAPLSDGALAAVARRCEHLRVLSVRGAHEITTLEFMEQPNMQKLEHLDVSNCRRLERLLSHNGIGDPTRSLFKRRYFQSALLTPLVQSVLKNVRPDINPDHEAACEVVITRLKNYVSGADLGSLPTHRELSWPNLRSLVFRHPAGSPAMPPQHEAAPSIAALALAAACPNLEILRIGMWSETEDDATLIPGTWNSMLGLHGMFADAGILPKSVWKYPENPHRQFYPVINYMCPVVPFCDVMQIAMREGLASDTHAHLRELCLRGVRMRLLPAITEAANLVSRLGTLEDLELTLCDFALPDAIAPTGGRARTAHGLRKINVRCCGQHGNIINVNDALMGRITSQATFNCQQLVSFNASCCDQLTNPAVIRLVRAAPLLAELDLCYCAGLTKAVLREAAHVMGPRMAMLGAGGFEDLNDLDLFDIVQRCPNIEELGIGGCTGLTRYFFVACFFSLNGIMWTQCSNGDIGGVDAGFLQMLLSEMIYEGNSNVHDLSLVLHVDEPGGKKIQPTLPRLTSLNAHELPLRMRTKNLRFLLHISPRLRSLDLKGCGCDDATEFEPAFVHDEDYNFSMEPFLHDSDIQELHAAYPYAFDHEID